MSNSKIHIILSGGGTGGHIFPAVAIANGLKEELGNRTDILFVGAKGRMEMEKIPAEGFPIKGLWISGIQRRLTAKNLLFPLKALVSLCKARKIIKSYKPAVTIGTGGYASGPLLYMASRLKIPTLILEQNSYPGITNKLLAKRADVICTAYEGMEKYFPKEKIVVTGSPIRKEIFHSTRTKKEAAAFFEIDENKKTVLVIGGSQGAKRINEAIAKNIDDIVTSETQLIWQTGKLSYEDSLATARQAKFKENIKVYDFIRRMDMAYAAADLVVSRSGAIAVAEIVALRKPAVFIPLPSAAEDHQTYNAKTLTEKDAALLLPEKDAESKLPDMIRRLTEDDKALKTLVKNLEQFEKTDAVKNITKLILNMIKKK